MTPAQAAKALKAIRHEDWRERQLARVEALPAPACAVGRALLLHDVWGCAAAKHLDELEVEHRLAVFEALFPQLGTHVEAAWQLHTRMPYQHDYEGRPFRAPSRPAASRPVRGDWLRALHGTLRGFEQDAIWVATWAAHLGGGYGAEELGVLLAAVIDGDGREGDTVFRTLRDEATTSSSVGRHVIRGLLLAARPEGWMAVEPMLSHPGTPEGRLLAVLETVHEAHPDAFRRILRTIIDQGLAAQAEVVRALNAWLGYQWDAVSVSLANKVLTQALHYLDDPNAARASVASPDGESVYLGLWALAVWDASHAVEPAHALLASKSTEHRFAAVHLLAQLDLAEVSPILRSAVDDRDLRISLRALEACREDGSDEDDQFGNDSDLFERIERLLPRLPRRAVPLEPILWPWQVLAADPASVAADLLASLGERPPTRLLPHVPFMEPATRVQVVEKLALQEPWDEETRDALFRLATDTHRGVREAALKALVRCRPTEQEAELLEDLIGAVGGPRGGVLRLLQAQTDESALASAERLMEEPNQAQRLAGLELLRQLFEARRLVDRCRGCAEGYRDRRAGKLTEEEQQHLGAILDD